ncbi:methyltransferase domain-containing protein [Nocardiopsis sp. CT-R113]|uniref:Methyltransferase domain-containing protein n=1 Tax=Nocardiopsis codii TaxID=3065942 RepID=A0ABU7KFY1_9ACTN|nr:methyltransferase domain-containing protein [Nocardiopsis sp. CT-R113]MEE2041123.1 methyltransferase domain-containing protein [Nocardiopsis sp. CT-R113]
MTAAPGVNATVYDRCAHGYDPHIAFFRTFGRRLVDLAGPAPGERVLDVATGRGACLFPAAERVGPAGRVDGVDLSVTMVELLTSDIGACGTANASVTRMDAQALTVPEASYDVVLCAFALFVMPDPRAAVAGFRRALRPGGRCAVSVPTATLVPGDVEEVREVFHSYAARAGHAAGQRGIYSTDPAALLEEAGFTDVRASEEVARFVFRDVTAWWEWTWTTGIRSFYESLPADLLEGLRREVFALLEPTATPDGLPPGTDRPRFATARRPESDG